MYDIFSFKKLCNCSWSQQLHKFVPYGEWRKKVFLKYGDFLQNDEKKLFLWSGFVDKNTHFVL